MNGLLPTILVMVVVEAAVILTAIRRWRGPISMSSQSQRNMEFGDGNKLLKGVVSSSAVVPFIFGSLFLAMLCGHAYRIAKPSTGRDVLLVLIVIGMSALVASIALNISIVVAGKPQRMIPPHLRNGGSLYGP